MSLSGQISAYWEERAESYSAQNRRQLNKTYFQWRDAIFRHIPRERGLRALDIGTGPGFLALLMAREGYQVDGADRNGAMLACARQNAAREEAEIAFHQVENGLPFPEESFDVLLSRDVVWVQPEPEEELERWYRLLKPGGTLLYFDADWYGYLRDENALRACREHRKRVRERGGFVYAGARDMEALARTLPLTYRERPRWDLDFWRQRPGAEVRCETNLNPQILCHLG